jgi:hypothetical protein
MHGPLSFGCNFSCKVKQDLAVGVADDERLWPCFGDRWSRTIEICGRFITVQLADGSISRFSEAALFRARKRMTRS